MLRIHFLIEKKWNMYVKLLRKTQQSSPKYPENVGHKIDKMPTATVQLQNSDDSCYSSW